MYMTSLLGLMLAGRLQRVLALTLLVCIVLAGVLAVTSMLGWEPLLEINNWLLLVVIIIALLGLLEYLGIIAMIRYV